MKVLKRYVGKKYYQMYMELREHNYLFYKRFSLYIQVLKSKFTLEFDTFKEVEGYIEDLNKNNLYHQLK